MRRNDIKYIYMFLSPLKNLARKGLKLLPQCLRGNELFPLSMDQVWDGTKSLQFQEFSANEYIGISKNKWNIIS